MADAIQEHPVNDDTTEGENDAASPATHAGQPETTLFLRGRLSIAEEQLRAATRVIESELGKAQARARALNAERRDVDG